MEEEFSVSGLSNSEKEKMKNDIISDFIEIQGTFKATPLRNIQKRCKILLEHLTKKDVQLADLIEVIDLILLFHKNDDKEEIQNEYQDLWRRYSNKNAKMLTMWDILLINLMIGSEPKLDYARKVLDKCLIALRAQHKDHEHRVRLESALMLNHMIALVDAIFFEAGEDLKFVKKRDERNATYKADSLMFIGAILKLNREADSNSTTIVAATTMYRGILMKMPDDIYLGMLLLKEAGFLNDKKRLGDLLTFYAKKYKIKV